MQGDSRHLTLSANDYVSYVGFLPPVGVCAMPGTVNKPTLDFAGGIQLAQSGRQCWTGKAASFLTGSWDVVALLGLQCGDTFHER